MYDHLRIYLPIIIFPAHLRYQVYEHVKWWCMYYHSTREGFSRIWFSVFETQWSKTTLAMHTWFYYVLIFIRYTLYKEWYFRQSNRRKNLINLNRLFIRQTGVYFSKNNLNFNTTLLDDFTETSPNYYSNSSCLIENCNYQFKTASKNNKICLLYTSPSPRD